MKRELSPTFMTDLKSGLLHPLLQQVTRDRTLMLAIRVKYINIYYRGSNLMLLKEVRGGYSARFNEKNSAAPKFGDLPPSISTPGDLAAWLNAFPEMKQYIDFRLSNADKGEREFQQVIFRENNYSRFSNGTEYFLSDIEYTPVGEKSPFRFDMLGIEWAASQRKKGKACRPIIVEVKYGDNAINGSASLKKHLLDMKAYLADHKHSLVDLVNSQTNQLRELGLIEIGKNEHLVDVQKDAVPVVIFLLANYTPRGGVVETQLEEIAEMIGGYADGGDRKALGFDVRFFVSSFAGYAMHRVNMLTLKEFKLLIKYLQKRNDRLVAADKTFKT